LWTVRGIADHRLLPGLAGAEQVADNDQAVATPTWAASGVSAAMISRATDPISDSPTYTARSEASS